MPYLDYFNGTTMIEFFRYPNSVTANMFWPGMLLIIGMIFFVGFKTFNTNSKEAFVATTFLLIPISIIFTVLEFIEPQISLVPIVLFILTAIVLYRDRGI